MRKLVGYAAALAFISLLPFTLPYIIYEYHGEFMGTDGDYRDIAVHALQGAAASFSLPGSGDINMPPRKRSVTTDNSAISCIRADVVSILKEYGDGSDHSPEAVAGAVVKRIGVENMTKLFFMKHLDPIKKEEAIRAVKNDDYVQAGLMMLQAVEEKVIRRSKQLSEHREGKRTLESVEGTRLRAQVPSYTENMIEPQEQWEHWYIEDHNGTVAMKSRVDRDGPKFLRALSDDSVKLSEVNENRSVDRAMMWKPLKHGDRSYSFLSVYGTWLSVTKNGSIITVADCKDGERFWLDSWKNSH